MWIGDDPSTPYFLGVYLLLWASVTGVFWLATAYGPFRDDDPGGIRFTMKLLCIICGTFGAGSLAIEYALRTLFRTLL